MGSVQGTLNGWNIWKIKDKELFTLIGGRRGGSTTMLILDEILNGPRNKNQLSRILNLDYNTVTYHVNLLHKHQYIMKVEQENHTYYHPTEKIFNSLEDYKIIKDYINNNKNK